MLTSCSDEGWRLARVVLLTSVAASMISKMKNATRRDDMATISFSLSVRKAVVPSTTKS